MVMIIDVSKSMGAEDYHPDSRLSKVRQIILEMLPHLRGNRVGFVTFAGNSFRQAELSEDFTALEFILKHCVSIDSAGLGGSDLVRALEPGSPSCRKRQTATVSSCSFQTVGMRRRICRGIAENCPATGSGHHLRCGRTGAEPYSAL